MEIRYKNQYRSDSLRLKNWNYGWNGAYFITICTRHRVSYFGTVVNKNMKLSPLGVIADILWYEIKNHTKNVELAEFVVMPNHIHGILVLNDTQTSGNGIGNDINVETRHALSLQSPQHQTMGSQRFQNQGRNTISSIIGSYKSAVSKHAHRLGFDFQWQHDYWEHIIRNEDEFNRISQYITENPSRWEKDKLNGGKGNVVMEKQSEYDAESWMV